MKNAKVDIEVSAYYEHNLVYLCRSLLEQETEQILIAKSKCWTVS